MDEEVYWRCRQEGGAWPVGGRVWLKLTGRDVTRFLHGQCTNDVKGWDGRRTLCAAVLSAKGQMCADVALARAGEAVILDGPEAAEIPLAERLERYVVADDVKIVPWEGRVVHAWGPAVEALAQGRLRSPHRRLGLEGADIFFDAGGHPPEPGRWLCPDAVAEVLRIEAGLAVWGRELDGETLPPEAGLEDGWISHSKGCYIGQEVISRIRSVGRVNRALVGFVGLGPGPLLPGAAVLLGDEAVGSVTSAAHSPSLQKEIALGYVRRQHSGVGTEVTANGVRALIVPLPFIQ